MHKSMTDVLAGSRADLRYKAYAYTFLGNFLFTFLLLRRKNAQEVPNFAPVTMTTQVH